MTSAPPKISNLTFEDTEFVQRLECVHVRLQLEQVLTLLPDHIIRNYKNESDYSKEVILLLIEVAGLAELCDNHHKLTNGGIGQLTATLNAFTACITEVVHFYGGDVLKFSGKQFLTCWIAEDTPTAALHNAIMCALYVQNALADFTVEVGIQLKLKFAVSYGDVNFVIVGDSVKDYALHGTAVDDIKFARALSGWGELVVSSRAFRCLNASNYQMSLITYGYAKIFRILDGSDNGSDDATVSLDELCRQHLEQRNKLEWQKGLNQIICDMEELEHYKSSLPLRQSVAYALEKARLDDLKPFVIKLLQNSLDDDPSSNFVNEIHNLAIIYIDIVTGHCAEKHFKTLIENVYTILQNFAQKYYGDPIWVSTFQRDVVAIVVFHLRNVRNESGCRNALLAAHSISNQVSKVHGVKKLSTAVCYGSVYCGLIGHPKRKTFVVIGTVIDKAVSLTNTFPNKIICDYSVYKNCRLPSGYFRLMSNHLIFEYSQSFDVSRIQPKLNIIGRDEEYDLLYAIVNHPEKFNYYGICFYGPKLIGKSKLLQWCFTDMVKDGYSIVSVDLCQCTQRPYFCLSNLYKQLYNQNCSVELDDYAFAKHLPTELWDISEILQSNNSTNSDAIKQKFRIMSLFREIVKHSPYGYTVIFIDNIQYIDAHSLDILETIISEELIRLICAGEFEKLYWNIRWRLSLNNHIKLLELRPLSEESISPFVCNFLHVKGVQKGLISILKNNCGGSPGIMEKIIYELSTKGYIELARITIGTNSSEYVISTPNQPSVTILVAQLKEDYQMTGDITDNVISMNIISQLRPFEFSILTFCVMLGEMFTTKCLLRLSNSPEYTLLCAIKQFFYLGILECGYQCLKPIGFTMEKCKCYCPEEASTKDKMLSKLPKIAFCSILHFRDVAIKQIVYNLIDEDDKIKMHQNIINHLENKENMCLVCIKNNCLPIINKLKFPLPFKECGNSNEESNPIEILNMGDYIHVINVENIKPKILDTTMCSCLEITLQSYSDLIEHSTRINCIDHKIFYMIEHANVVMRTKEYEQCILLLFGALSISKSIDLNTFRIIQIARINMLIAKAFSCVENMHLAKQYLKNSLKLFLSIMPNLKAIKSCDSYGNDFAECLCITINFFVKIGEWKLAKFSSHLCLWLVKNISLTTTILYEVCSTIIPVYYYTGDKRRCRILVKVIHKEMINMKVSSLQELLLLIQLFKVIFYERLLDAKLNSSIRLGYKIANLTKAIYFTVIQLDVLVTLAWSLMAVKRIQDSVQVGKILHEMGENANDLALLYYYIVAMELILETSFTLEPYANIQLFATNYFKVRKRNNYTAMERTFLLYLYNYHLRNNRWRDIFVWKNYLTFTDFVSTDLQSTKNLFKFTENILITLGRNDVGQSRSGDVKYVERHMEMCKLVTEKFKLFLPRYYHFKSYFMRILDKKGKSRKYLDTAFKIAMQNGNTLEYCWLMQSRNSWEGGFSFEGDRKCVDWKFAKGYAPIHWSQILYGLPLHL